MIYIIIGRDVKGNEWVMADTYDDATQATKRCEALNNIQDGLAADDIYRVETVENKQDFKMKRNAAYGRGVMDINSLYPWNFEDAKDAYNKAKMDHEEGYPDSDSIRTKDFTIDELFPQGTHAVAYTLTCSECACEVKNVLNPYLIKHTDWHNKLLP